MILADKIIENRKKNGWSQEDLAFKLGVSRQSVSKWEGAQSVPDMKKIVQMSELFGVSTDYLLKDEIEDPAPGEAETVPEVRYDDEETRNVSMEEANEFLASNEKHAGRISTGVMLCILSPVFLIVLAGIVDAKWINMSVKAVTGTGITVLLLLIAAAVGIFVTSGMALSRFDYLEKNRIETEYGVSGMVRRMKEEHMPYYTRDVVIGVILFIVSVIPVIGVSLAFGDGSVPAPLISGTGSVTGLISICTGLLLVLVAIGVKLIVKTSTIKGGMDKLLEEGDYTPIEKKVSRYDGIYWTIITAAYLAYSFITMDWGRSWIIWPVAGVLFALYRAIIKAKMR
ncbi:MAG: helix-turn-helix transcriptional regulator [Firmicutes bacterium]|nr:helix-turn-helix transcriptional regulator [Bacillota bacterium]